jgi:hypothetical protein
MRSGKDGDTNVTTSQYLSLVQSFPINDVRKSQLDPFPRRGVGLPRLCIRAEEESNIDNRVVVPDDKKFVREGGTKFCLPFLWYFIWWIDVGSNS